MCEPYHSIVQFKDPDRFDDDDNLSGQATSGGGFLRKLGHCLKSVGKWLHLSKMGIGHSEALGKISINAWTVFDKEATRYEAAWWNRTLKIDGSFKSGMAYDKDLAFDAAHAYADAVSLGSITALRRYLEKALVLAERPHLHYSMFVDKLLTKNGKNAFLNKLSLVGVKRLNDVHDIDDSGKQRLMKLALGFTRKRKLLVPEWADDNKIWQPGGLVEASTHLS